MVGMLQAVSSCSPSHYLLRGKGVVGQSGIESVKIAAFSSRPSAQASRGQSPVVHVSARTQPGNAKQGSHVGGRDREQRNAGRRRVTQKATLGVTDKLDNQEKRTVKTVRIHYNRKDGDYEQWGLHVWGDAEYCTPWESPLVARGLDDFGSYWDVDCVEGGKVYFLIHTGRDKEFEGVMDTAKSDSVWVVSEHPDVFMEKPDLDSIPKGDLGFARALWVSEQIIAVNFDGDCYSLHACKNANLTLTAAGVEGASEKIQLEEDVQGLPIKVVEKFPYITGYKALRVPKGIDTRELVKCQLALSSCDSAGVPLDATGVQLPGVLDDLFAYDGPLGVSIIEDNVSLSVWAPTAQSVRLILFHSPAGGEHFEVLQMNESDGVWSVQGPAEWKGKYYLYEVTVFHPTTQKVEKSLACDPYSRGLSANGERSLIVDLNDESLKPEGWSDLAAEKPKLAAFTDIAIYELHIRDFSIADETVDPALRGTYLAFTEKESAGVNHLKNLAKAGLSHLHLLPCFDFASVDEKKRNWKSADVESLKKFAPDSEEQQAAITLIQDEDAYNWGYDPVNWGVPEGSYATAANGSVRTFEFRKMVQAINHLGLRVVLDVVYNHLHGNGPTGIHTVHDKIVPGYYLRRNKDGNVENSTCMNNTASEHYMVDRLIVDDLRHWAVAYKVDGFRFDLMGHLMKSTMLRAQSVLRSLTVEKDGVDGSKIYLYGEGWDFGEVSNNMRGVNGSQRNLAGTGIGSFNDRLRDTVIGGSPFGDPLQQGFLTGLSLQPNELDQGDEQSMANHLAATTDWIRLGLGSNLRTYVFTNSKGEEVKGEEVLTHDGVPVAYAMGPEDLVNYVSAHDNESLFDIIMLKTASGVSLKERCRINHMATSVVALAQGIPFFHAGDDMLRSKSLDRDSYNSGDWFNRLDFSYETNNFGVGLPPKSKNGFKWPIMKKLLSDPANKPSKNQILAAVENLKELLKIRFSSPLFRLKSANAIQARLKFHNTGPAGVPGVIIYSIEDGEKGKPGLTQLDSRYRNVIVIFNARPTQVKTEVQTFKARSLSLHPIQAASQDEIVRTSTFDSKSGTFSIPARTTAVFVESR
ncbi:pullulanase [Marchantia polymorpha subsp. ruderalis]